MVLRDPHRLVTTFRTIAVVEDCTLLAREVVLVVVVMLWAEGAGSQEGEVLSYHGVGEASVAVAVGVVRCGPPRNLNPGTLFSQQASVLAYVFSSLCNADSAVFRTMQ